MAKITGKQEILADLEKRVADKILEQSNFDLLKKLVENADTLDEAIKIAELGTTYKRTGFHFDKRLERQNNAISYFKKNKELSFETDKNAITHKLIVGDNYPALLNLLVEYKGKIDVIYIDPPYGKDSMGEFAETNYENAITRDNLLSMLYPRLIVAKQLLSESGVIFCSIDDRNQAYVKCLFDEVFEERNFVAEFVWKCRNSLQHDEPLVSSQTERILIYAKDITLWNSDDGYKFNRIRKPFDANEYNNPDNDPRGPWLSSGKTRNDGRPAYTVVSPTGVKFTKQWIPSPKEFERWDKEGLIWWGKDGNSMPRKKAFLKDFQGNAISDILMDEYTDEVKDDKLKRTKRWEIGTTESGTKGMKELFDDIQVFDYPKPWTLIKYLITISSHKNAIVLDFFAGSGTAGQAVLELNKEDKGQRTFICVQLPENLDDAIEKNKKNEILKNQIALCDKLKRPHNLAEITCERLRRVMTGKDFAGNSDFKWAKDNKPLGGNLDVYDIAEVANFENVKGKTPFDVIDETLYGNEKFMNVKEKVEWVCDNFEVTQKRLEE